jgi:hypothetical protein
LGHAKEKMIASVKNNGIPKRDGSRLSVLRSAADFKSKNREKAVDNAIQA